MSASRQRQLSHVSHENVTQSPNPFPHYSQCLDNYTSWCYPAVWHAHIGMRLRQCPPISALTTPYAFTPPPLPSLRSRGALPTFLRRH
ncbi:hypothetical protein O181_101179 [Austropuccinia psidii MF-1]|uniref:Uncharacterized protein n=1 Tax=Austropuccinia psidii MF-1 TaxID=1389203 RepID=A0A9Q3JG27_9BASI|nr:hypothetical protein [Austropuccinia psidii MF-1]